MLKYIKLFETTSEYDVAKDNLELPNVSYCEDNDEVHYNPWFIETRVIVTFSVTSTSEPTKILYDTANISAVEIDGIEQSSVNPTYTFSTKGVHIIKYTLIDPTSTGDGTFAGCTGLTKVIIPDSVTAIGISAFGSCKNLTSITIPNSVISIGNGAFASCSNLASITIPNSVTSIDDGAFFSCSSLTSITSLAATAPTIQNQTFRGIKTGGTLYVPSGSTGYDVWMGTGEYYLGYYNWTQYVWIKLYNPTTHKFAVDRYTPVYGIFQIYPTQSEPYFSRVGFSQRKHEITYNVRENSIDQSGTLIDNLQCYLWLAPGDLKVGYHGELDGSDSGWVQYNTSANKKTIIDNEGNTLNGYNIPHEGPVYFGCAQVNSQSELIYIKIKTSDYNKNGYTLHPEVVPALS